MVYFIADNHFFHNNLNTSLDNRGFSGLEEMHSYMIRQWNSRVTDKDDVYVLGDFSTGSVEETLTILDKLRGKIYLLRGNHDYFLSKMSELVQEVKFKWVKEYAELSINKRRIILCHYPVMCYNRQYRIFADGRPGTYMLHGHVHNTQDQKLIDEYVKMVRKTQIETRDGGVRCIPCNIINCFCMYSDYVPMTLDEWIIINEERLNRVA